MFTWQRLLFQRDFWFLVCGEETVLTVRQIQNNWRVANPATLEILASCETEREAKQWAMDYAIEKELNVPYRRGITQMEFFILEFEEDWVCK